MIAGGSTFAEAIARGGYPRATALDTGHTSGDRPQIETTREALCFLALEHPELSGSPAATEVVTGGSCGALWITSGRVWPIPPAGWALFYLREVTA